MSRESRDYLVNMGAAEHLAYLRHHEDKRIEIKQARADDIALHNGTVKRYQELKVQYEKDIKEFNESVIALQTWQNELEGRKKELDAMLLDLQKEELELDKL